MSRHRRFLPLAAASLALVAVFAGQLMSTAVRGDEARSAAEETHNVCAQQVPEPEDSVHVRDCESDQTARLNYYPDHPAPKSAVRTGAGSSKDKPFAPVEAQKDLIDTIQPPSR